MKKFFYLICFVSYFCAISLNAQRWVENTAVSGLLPVGYYVTSTAAVTDSVVWVLAVDFKGNLPGHSKLLRTLNSGTTWQVFDVTAINGLYPTAMSAFDSLTVLISTLGGNNFMRTSVFKTTDGSRSWTEKLRNIKTTDLFKFSDKRNGILIGVQSNIVANTADGGDTWTVDSTTQREFAGETITYRRRFDFNKDTVCFTTGVDTLGTRVPRFFRSTDKGRTWQRFNLPNSSSFNDVSTTFKDGKNGLMATVVFTSQGSPMQSLLKTSNGGELWEAVPNLPSFFTRVQVPSVTYIPNTKNSYVLMGVNIGLNSQYTIDGGQNWTPITAIPIPTESRSFSPGETVFSSSKVGWFTLSSDNFSPKIYKWDSGNALSHNKDIASNIALNVSPNPSAGIVHIAWQDTQNTPPQYLRISDAQGKIVFEKKGFDSNATSQSIDLKAVANGLYFIEIQNQNTRSVKKVVIQH